MADLWDNSHITWLSRCINIANGFKFITKYRGWRESSCDDHCLFAKINLFLPTVWSETNMFGNGLRQICSWDIPCNAYCAKKWSLKYIPVRHRLHDTARHGRSAVPQNGFHCSLWEYLHVDGADAIAVNGAGAIGCRRLMGLVPIGPWCSWVPLDAVDGAGAGASAVSCKRTLIEVDR